VTDELKAIEESAKAGQEIAKTAGKVIDISQMLGSFIARFISGSLEQGVGIVEDKLKYMRWERQVRLMQRAEEYMARIGLTNPTRPVPLKVVVPLFEYASLEDDNDIQDLFAKLLVNAADADRGIEIKRIYISILENIEALEAQILEKIYSFPFEEMQHNGLFTKDLPEEASIRPERYIKPFIPPRPEVELALANLARIGCLHPTLSAGGGEVFGVVHPSILGKKFVEACTLRRDYSNNLTSP